MSKRRATIARRLVEAQSTAAMLTTFNEVDMTAVMALRERHKQSFKERHGVGLGIASFFVKAVDRRASRVSAHQRRNPGRRDGAQALLRHRRRRRRERGARRAGAARCRPDVVRRRSSSRSATSPKRAEDGTLSLADLKGGTFTITNGGVFGSLLSTPILNPPQVGILGLHAIQQRPVASNGQVVDPADDVRGAHLRSPHRRRLRGGAVPRPRQAARRGSGRAAARLSARVRDDWTRILCVRQPRRAQKFRLPSPRGGRLRASIENVLPRQV